MSLRTRALGIADKLRGIPARAAIDIRTTTVTVRKRTWPSGRVGVDAHFDVVLVLFPTPKVREVSTREIAGSGGWYAAGDVRVGPVTPKHATGGYTAEQLRPTITERGVELVYVLEGGVTGEYKVLDLATDRALSYWLTLRRKRSTP